MGIHFIIFIVHKVGKQKKEIMDAFFCFSYRKLGVGGGRKVRMVENFEETEALFSVSFPFFVNSWRKKKIKWAENWRGKVAKRQIEMGRRGGKQRQDDG